MSSYRITSTASDLSDEPEVLFTNFLKTGWNDIASGVNQVNIDWGYEPGDGQNPFIIKIEENFTDVTGIDITDRYDQHDFIMDCHIWMHDSKKKTTLGYSGFVNYLFRMRKYVESFIKINRNGMQPEIKHLYLIGGRNVREPERTDWHHAVVTFRMCTFKVLLPP